MAFIGENAVWAWVNFNGRGTVSIRDSFRVSSISDNGRGVYQVNLSSSAGNAASVLIGGVEDNANTIRGDAIAFQRRGTYSANAHRIRCWSSRNLTVDFTHVHSITMKS